MRVRTSSATSSAATPVSGLKPCFSALSAALACSLTSMALASASAASSAKADCASCNTSAGGSSPMAGAFRPRSSNVCTPSGLSICGASSRFVAASEYSSGASIRLRSCGVGTRGAVPTTPDGGVGVETFGSNLPSSLNRSPTPATCTPSCSGPLANSVGAPVMSARCRASWSSASWVGSTAILCLFLFLGLHCCHGNWANYTIFLHNVYKLIIKHNIVSCISPNSLFNPAFSFLLSFIRLTSC